MSVEKRLNALEAKSQALNGQLKTNKPNVNTTSEIIVQIASNLQAG